MSFSAGDWIFVSYYGTSRDTDKTRLKWLGPQMVPKVISDDVYVVTNVLGHEQTVHASRMYPYEGPDYNPSDSVREVFYRDYSELLLDKILEVKWEDGEVFLLIKWLGFEENFNSWEPMNSIIATHKELVRKFFIERKLKLPKELVVDMNIRTVEMETIDNQVQVVDDINNQLQRWTSIEVDILRLCILKFGFGCWNELGLYLNFKTHQQIYNRLKKELFQLDFTIMNGIRFDLSEIRQILVLQHEQNKLSSNSKRNVALPVLTRNEFEAFKTEN